MNIDIIGGSGFIGTRLATRLVQRSEYSVRIIDKNPSQTHSARLRQADVRNLAALRSVITPDSAIVNLAAEHRDDVRPRSLYDDVNVTGARNLCTVAREKRVRTMVFTSSVAVYGFGKIGVAEDGPFRPFGDYGRTKLEAEKIFLAWQAEAPAERTLVIIRPTVVFGEQNRGNVYNLLRQIAKGRFMMVGSGENRKSMAYVENVAAFIEYSLGFSPGVHTYNYVDKPDFTMNELVLTVNRALGRKSNIGPRLPYSVGLAVGKFFDFAATATGKNFPISSIRVKKFCADSVYCTAVEQSGFVPPVRLEDGLGRTIRYEFLESHVNAPVFFSE